MRELIIKPIGNTYSQQVINLILPIQQIEFQVPVTLADQPDLQDIENFYLKPGGGFWGAFQDDVLIGTIALIAADARTGVIRKMFVRKEYRGGEIAAAQQLLNVLTSYCREHDITDIYLGTVDILKAAQRFYLRNGFEEIPKATLPACFPLMSADNVFFHQRL